MPGTVLAQGPMNRTDSSAGDERGSAGAPAWPAAEGTPMQELRLVAVSEDGTYVVLTQPGRGTRFSLPNDERLRAVVRGQFSRLAQYEIEVESPLRPKEIQARIRAGETAEQIADAAGVPVERVRWFEGPVLAERAYVAQQAQTASVRRPGDSGPGPRLGEVVAERLRLLGADPDEARWDSRKQGDGSWLVELTSPTGAERRTAAWIFDSRRRHAAPEDDEAARLSLPEEVLRAAGLSVQPPEPARGLGTVTPFVPRSSTAAARHAAPEASPGHQAAPHSAHQPAEPTAVAAATESAAAVEPAPAAESAAIAAPAAAAEQVRAAAVARHRDTGTDSTEMRRQPARQPGPQASPSDLPQLQPPAPSPGPGVEEADPAVKANQESPARTRSARKAAGGRGRRASVPTWDEIMFGSSRPQE